MCELDQNSSGADEQKRPVERVVARAHDGLHPRTISCTRNPCNAGVRMRFRARSDERIGGGLHRLGIAQVERDPAGFGLMQDVVGRIFNATGKPMRSAAAPPRRQFPTASLFGMTMP